MYLICLILFLFVAILLGFVYLNSTEMPSLKTIYLTLGRDIRAAYRTYKLKSFMIKSQKSDKTLIDYFRATTEKRKHTTCFIFKDEKWTYQMVEEFSNKIANYFDSCGYLKGDEVALILDNCPEYVCIWLGLAKIGVITALIDTNLKTDSLQHCVNCIEAKAIIFGRNFSETVKDAMPYFKNKEFMQFLCFTERGDSTNEVIPFAAKSLNVLLDATSSYPIDPEKYKIGFKDKLVYIYTSGTTGLPKSAIVRHSRCLWISAVPQYLTGMGDSEVIYDPLPMFHLTGGLVFVSMIFVFGGSIIIRKKFSASNYFKEAAKHKATVGQYIGEICRYLLQQPISKESTQHCIKFMFGNGLRSHIWKEFQEKFRIKHIVEIFGSTEGNSNLFNIFSKTGAVGFIPRICDRLFPVSLFKVDTETREVLRNEDGLCVRCKPGENGEVMGQILVDPFRSFDGYLDEKETDKKIIQNCFEKGDRAFRSGDICVMDEEGYVYFVDRVGDTFRWQGQNVSTCQVENVASSALKYVSCVVYGVNIPNVEGKAGMLNINDHPKNVEFTKLYEDFSRRLPSYAIPLFLRFSDHIEETGTFKFKKVMLEKEGFHPEKVRDPLFFLDAKQKTYIPLGRELYSQIVTGNLRL